MSDFLLETLTDVRHDKGGAVPVLPEHDPPHPPPSHVGGVVLSPHEAVLHHLVARGPHTVPVGSPGEDLDPADDVVRVIGLVGDTSSSRTFIFKMKYLTN